MGYSVFLFLLGALIAVLLTPASVRAAVALGAIDHPDAGRHRHAHPTPRLGGLAIFFAAAVTALLFFPLDGITAAWLSGSALIVALGVSDDLYTLPPLPKLLALGAIATLPIAFGLAPDTLILGTRAIFLSHPWNNLFALFWVLLLSNAFNLIDGSDGLAASLATLSALSLFLLSGHPETLLLAGTAFGFLPYNRPALSSSGHALPTRSFLGDTGALFLGYSLAVFSLHGGSFSLAIPLLFTLPVFDLFRVFFLRLCRGKSPFDADRSHLHHLLAARGWSPGGILLFSLFLSLLGVLLAATAI